MIGKGEVPHGTSPEKRETASMGKSAAEAAVTRGSNWTDFFLKIETQIYTGRYFYSTAIPKIDLKIKILEVSQLQSANPLNSNIYEQHKTNLELGWHS